MPPPSPPSQLPIPSLPKLQQHATPATVTGKSLSDSQCPLHGSLPNGYVINTFKLFPIVGIYVLHRSLRISLSISMGFTNRGKLPTLAST